MSASDNAITLASHVIESTLAPFAADPRQAGLIVARALFRAGLTHDVEAAITLLRNRRDPEPSRKDLSD